MRRVTTPWILIVAALIVAGAGRVAADVTVRLATIVPRNSIWYNALSDMGATWMKTTEKRVRLTVYEGGSQGDERTALKLMRPEVDTINAALMTAPGMADIDDAFNIFGIPFFFESEAEQRHVREKLTPQLSRRLEAKGFHVVGWGFAGWVQLFSKMPIRTLADLKAAKLFTTEGDERMEQWYIRHGFSPRAIKTTDMATAMTTGLINAAPSPAYAAAVIQLYRSADYMLDIRVAPLIGATLVTTRVWNQISADDRARLVAAGQVMEKRLDTEVPAQDAKSVDDMKLRNRRFTVVTLDAAARAAFRAEAEKLAATMRGGMVPAEIYDAAVAERDLFRKTRGAKGQ
jgi:TRAP-type C4-dicarboxylate transport system substrate-binding protein